MGSAPGRPLFPGLGRYLPTDSRPCWNQQSSLSNDRQAQRKARMQITVLRGMKVRDGKDCFFLNPRAPIFFASPDSTPKRNLSLNFLMDRLSSQCLCETVPRSDRARSREENGQFRRREFCYHFPDRNAAPGAAVRVSGMLS